MQSLLTGAGAGGSGSGKGWSGCGSGRGSGSIAVQPTSDALALSTFETALHESPMNLYKILYAKRDGRCSKATSVLLEEVLLEQLGITAVVVVVPDSFVAIESRQSCQYDLFIVEENQRFPLNEFVKILRGNLRCFSPVVALLSISDEISPLLQHSLNSANGVCDVLRYDSSGLINFSGVVSGALSRIPAPSTSLSPVFIPPIAPAKTSPVSSSSAGDSQLQQTLAYSSHAAIFHNPTYQPPQQQQHNAASPFNTALQVMSMSESDILESYYFLGLSEGSPTTDPTTTIAALPSNHIQQDHQLPQDLHISGLQNSWQSHGSTTLASSSSSIEDDEFDGYYQQHQQQEQQQQYMTLHHYESGDYHGSRCSDASGQQNHFNHPQL